MDVNLFTPHVGQKEIINGFADSKHKFGVVASPRQYGKSLLGQNLLLYWLLQNPNQKGAWISPIYNQSKKVFQELIGASHQLIDEKNKADLSIKFINGSTLLFLSAERYDSIRGFSFTHLVIDEGAFIREQAINEAILPTLTAIGKKCLIISTPKGKNWFYNYWLRGNQLNETYISFKGDSLDNPYADKEFIEEQRRSLPDDIYRQEYLAEFTDAGSEVFRGLDNVSLINSYTNESKERCFVGIDTGLSNDYSVLCVINEHGRVLLMDRRNGDNISTIAGEFISKLSRYNIVGGFIETNGIGRAMYDLINPKQRRLQPFITTQDSKTQIVRSLIEDIEGMNLELPTKQLDAQLHKELSLYTYKLGANGKLSFTHPNGEHDDMVDALMLANKARNEIRTSRIYIGRN